MKSPQAPQRNSKADSRNEMLLWMLLSIVAWGLPLLALSGIPGSLFVGLGAPFFIWMSAASRLEGRWRMFPVISLLLIGFVIVAIVLYAILIIVNLNTMVEEKRGVIPPEALSDARMTS